MRIDPKELPLRHQEQLAAAVLAQIAKAAPVEVREEAYIVNRRPVRRLTFVNDRAACRYRILRKQMDSGAIQDLVMIRNPQGNIMGFVYEVKGEY